MGGILYNISYSDFLIIEFKSSLFSKFLILFIYLKLIFILLLFIFKKYLYLS